MNQRLRKKMHRRYANEVVIDVSTGDYFRQLLRNTAPYEKIQLKVTQPKYFSAWVTSPSVRYKLKYNLYRTECDEGGMCMFYVEASDYPKIIDASLNCLDLDYNG